MAGLVLTNGGTVRIRNRAKSLRGMDLFQGTIIVDGGLVDASNDGIRFQPPTGSTAAVILTNNGTIRIGSGGNFRLGHNGTAIVANSDGALGYQPANLRIGSLQTGIAAGFLNGSVADVALYDTALSATQVQQIYAAKDENLAPPNLAYTYANGVTTLSWTGNFKLQAQTNALSVGLGTNWGDYPGGSSSPVTVPVSSNNGTVFSAWPLRNRHNLAVGPDRPRGLEPVAGG